MSIKKEEKKSSHEYKYLGQIIIVTLGQLHIDSVKRQWPSKKLGAEAVFDQVTSESSLVATEYDFDELLTMMIDIDNPSTFYPIRKEELDDSNFRALDTVHLRVRLVYQQPD